MFEKLLAERADHAVGGSTTWFTDHPLEERSRSRRRAIRSRKINPAIIRTLTTNTQAFNDFKARVRALPPAAGDRRARASGAEALEALERKPRHHRRARSNRLARNAP